MFQMHEISFLAWISNIDRIRLFGMSILSVSGLWLMQMWQA